MHAAEKRSLARVFDINIGSKYVIPDIAGGHLICSLYIIPRYGEQAGARVAPTREPHVARRWRV